MTADSEDEWSVRQLDLDAYLSRVGYTGPAEPTGAVLERLGFRVDRLLARVGPDGGPARGRTHLTLRVTSGQDAWLADPGLGSSSPAPLSLRRYRSGGPQEFDGWAYEVSPDDEHGQEVWKLRAFADGAWTTMHRWTYDQAHPVDVFLSNYCTSTHPGSWFTWQPIVVRRDPDAIRSLLGRTYTVSRPGRVKERRELSDDEFARALTGEFGLRLTPDEVAAVVAARPAGTRRTRRRGPRRRPAERPVASGHGRAAALPVPPDPPAPSAHPNPRPR